MGTTFLKLHLTSTTLSVGTMSRWTIIGHHVCHGGFDKCSDGKFNRFKVTPNPSCLPPCPPPCPPRRSILKHTLNSLTELKHTHTPARIVC